MTPRFPDGLETGAQALAIAGFPNRRRQRGVAIVEFAMVALLLVTLAFGMIDFSVVFMNKVVLTNASREGAREGARYTSYTQAQRILNAQTKAKEYADPATGTKPLINFGTGTVTVPTPTVADGKITVVVQFPYTGIFFYKDGTVLQATTVMKYEG